MVLGERQAVAGGSDGRRVQPRAHGPARRERLFTIERGCAVPERHRQHAFAGHPLTTAQELEMSHAMNLTQHQPRLERLAKECTVSAAPALLLAAGLCVIAVLFGLGTMLG